MLSKLKNIERLIHIFLGAGLSLALIYFSTSLRILNPKYDGWLSVGDGRHTVSWYFFRNTPFPDWLLGNIPSYGLEISRSIYFYIPAIYMYPMRLVSEFIESQFQFIGWVIFINLFFQYYISSKILKIYTNHFIVIFFASFLVTISPFLLTRYTVHDHYFLTSHWLILAGFYLFLTRNFSKAKWSFLIILSLLHFPYFTAMLLVIYYVFTIYNFIYKRENKSDLIINLITVHIGLVITLFFIGFFKDSSVSGSPGLGLFRANLNTFFDPSGWSRLLPDLAETSGDYEGFAFLGIGILIIILISTISLFSVRNKHIFRSLLRDFNPLFFASFLLYLFALSTDIAFGRHEIIDFNYPYPIQGLVSAFRSTGRFTWPLAYTITLFFLIYIIKINKKHRTVLFLFFVLSLQFFDILPMLASQRDLKFSKIYTSPLSSTFWDEAADCYSAIHQLPAVLNSDNQFDFARKAAQNNLGIYPTPVDRVGDDLKNQLIFESRLDVRLGNYRNDRIYVFRNAYGIPEEEVNLDKRIALNTLPTNAKATFVDGFLVILPNFSNCPPLQQDRNFLPKQKDFLTESDTFSFSNQVGDSGKYLIDGWSSSEPWGTWTNSDRSGLLFTTTKPRKIKSLEITGHGFRWKKNIFPIAKLILNGVEIGNLSPRSSSISTYSFEIPESVEATDTYYLELEFDLVKSPLELGISQDNRELGFMLKELVIK